MIAQPQDLLVALQGRGLVAESVTEPMIATPNHRPWYLQALLGASGWFAGLFMLLCVAMLVHSADQTTLGVVGGFMLTVAWILFFVSRQLGSNAFFSQLALTLSLAGQCCVIYALKDLVDSHDSLPIESLAVPALVVQLVLILAMPDRLHRAFSTVFASIAWATTVRWLVVGDRWFDRGASAVSPGQTLVLWSAWLPLIILLWTLIFTEHKWMAAGWQSLARPVSTGLVVALALGTVVTAFFNSPGTTGDLSSGRATVMWPLLAACIALSALAAAFQLGQRWLAGLCVLAVLLHTSIFYYNLGVSLLVKSLLMLGLGVALLLVSPLLAVPLPPAGERT